MKKKYCKPQVIDFSIETVTGIGTGIASSACSGGPTPIASCFAGTGASNSCSPLGSGVTVACGNGEWPYQSGVMCAPTGASAQSCAADGSSASGSRSYCATGGSPTVACFPGSTASGGCVTGTSAGVLCTLTGASPSGCMTGNSEVPHS